MSRIYNTVAATALAFISTSAAVASTLVPETLFRTVPRPLLETLFQKTDDKGYLAYKGDVRPELAGVIVIINGTAKMAQTKYPKYSRDTGFDVAISLPESAITPYNV